MNQPGDRRRWLQQSGPHCWCKCWFTSFGNHRQPDGWVVGRAPHRSCVVGSFCGRAPSPFARTAPIFSAAPTWRPPATWAWLPLSGVGESRAACRPTADSRRISHPDRLRNNCHVPDGMAAPLLPGRSCRLGIRGNDGHGGLCVTRSARIWSCQDTSPSISRYDTERGTVRATYLKMCKHVCSGRSGRQHHAGRREHRFRHPHRQ